MENYSLAQDYTYYHFQNNSFRPKLNKYPIYNYNLNKETNYIIYLNLNCTINLIFVFFDIVFIVNNGYNIVCNNKKHSE